MRVSKNQVTLLAAAVAALFAASAQAQVVLNAAGTNTPTNSYASELTVSATAPLLLGTTALQNVTGVIGIGASGGQNRYYRFDTAGATFIANTTAMAIGTGVLTAGSVTTVAPATAPAYAVATGTNVTLVASGSNFVVYQVTAAPAGIAVTDNFAFVGAYSVPAASPVRLTMTTHETLVSATTQPNVTLLQTLSGTVINFQAALAFSMNAAQTETVAATTTFQSFCDGGQNVGGTTGTPGTAGCAAAGTNNTVIIGGISGFGLNANRLDATGTAITTLSTVISAATLTVTPSTGSDFTNTAATAPVGFSAGANGAVGVQPCVAGSFLAGLPVAAVGFPTVASAALNTAKTSALFGFTVPAGTNNPGTAGTTNRSLCATYNGTSNIPAQTFNGVLTTTAVTGFTAPTVSATGIGAFVRDGAELQSPWFSFGGTRYISRFFFMNTGTTGATCTASTLAETGNVLTAGPLAAGFTIPAGGQLAVLGSDIVASATGAGRAAVRFACAAPSASIQGRYVITDSLNGALDSGTLLRPGTN